MAAAGMPVSPAAQAEAEVHVLRRLGARVRRDAAGKPCVDPGDAKAVEWARRLDASATAARDAVEEAQGRGVIALAPLSEDEGVLD